MPLYLVSYEAEIHVQVEAEDRLHADNLARINIQRGDIELVSILDIECLSEDSPEP